MDNKIVILTGATSGIGLEVAKELYSQGYYLILGNRNMEKAKRVKKEIMETNSGGNIDLLEIDLSSFSSIKNFTDEIYKKYPRIDILINNAGLFSRQLKYTKEGYEMSKGVNYLGTYYLTELLLDKMKEQKDSKIINVSSVGCYWSRLKIKDNFFNKRVTSFIDYFDSKKANLIHTIVLKERLQEDNVHLYAADPGIVYSRIWKWRTRFGRFLGKIQKKIMKSAVEGSKIIVSLATDEITPNNSDIFLSSKGPKKLPKQAQNSKFRRDFIAFTKRIISKQI